MSPPFRAFAVTLIAFIARPAPALDLQHVHINANLDSTVMWQSNLFLRDKNAPTYVRLGNLIFVEPPLPIESDFIAQIRPGLSATVGDEDSILMGRARVGAEFLRFHRFAALDRQTPFFSVDFQIDRTTTRFSGSFSHEETSLPSQGYRSQDGLVNRTTQAARAGIDHDVTDASQLRIAVALDTRNFGSNATGNYPDDRTLSGTLEWRYHFSERLYLGPGLRPRTRTIGSLYSVDDYTAYLVAWWEAGPSLSIGSTLGYGETTASKAGPQKSFGSATLNARVLASEILAFDAGFSRDLSTDLLGSLHLNDRATVGATWSPKDTLSTRAGVDWSRLSAFNAPDREQLVDVSLSQSAQFSARFTVSLAVRYDLNHGNYGGANYANISTIVSGGYRW